MTNYSRGTRLEYAVRDIYKRRGALSVRSAGSRGPLDFVFLDGPITELVQCKRRIADAPLAMTKMKLTVPRGPGRVLVVWALDGKKPVYVLGEIWE